MLEDGFDQFDRFFFISLCAKEALTEIWRRAVISLFLDKGLLNPSFAQTPFRRHHCGFSIESGTRLYDGRVRVAPKPIHPAGAAELGEDTLGPGA